MFYIVDIYSQLCRLYKIEIFNQIINHRKMKTNILLILAIIGMACTSPKAKETEKNTETKQETSITSNSKGDNSSSKSTSQDDGFKVVKGDVKMEFDIKNLNADGNPIKLIGMYVDKKYIADSAKIHDNGKFEFTNDKLFLKGFYYVVLPGNKVIKLLLDNDQTFKYTADASDIDKTAKIDGSLANKLYYEDLNFKRGIDVDYGPIARKIGNMSLKDPQFKDTYKKFLQLSKKYSDRNDYYLKKYPDNFFTKFKIGGKNPVLTYPANANGELDVSKQVEEYRKHFWDGFDFNEEGLINTPAFTNKLKRYFTELIGQNQDQIIKYADVLMDKCKNNDEYYKVISNWITLKYEPGKTKLMDGEAVYSHMILKYFTPERATWMDGESIKILRKRAGEMVQSLLNKPAGNVTARGFDGQVHTILDSKKPVIIVFIYNPNCEHCEKQTPELIQFYRKWKNKGVEVFSIAANTTEPEWKGFHNRFNLPWVDLFDATNASWYPKYFVDVTPELYVIDKDRKIFAKNLNVGQLETIMARINK